MSMRQLGRRANNLLWGLRHRFDPRHRYNVVRTGLPAGYYDPDTRMLHACMALLCAYIEEGHGGADKLDAFSADLLANPDPHAPGSCARQAASQSEATAIYRWWKVDRPANHARLDKWCTLLFGDARDKSMGTEEEHWAFEKKLNADDQQMLHRLIDIRPSLWA